jgi:hypothetical protein
MGLSWRAGALVGVTPMAGDCLEGAYASRERLTGGKLAPALVPGATIDVAGLIA